MTFKKDSIISDITWYDDYIRVLSRYTWSFLKTNPRESKDIYQWASFKDRCALLATPFCC